MIDFNNLLLLLTLESFLFYFHLKLYVFCLAENTRDGNLFENKFLVKLFDCIALN